MAAEQISNTSSGAGRRLAWMNGCDRPWAGKLAGGAQQPQEAVVAISTGKIYFSLKHIFNSFKFFCRGY